MVARECYTAQPDCKYAPRCFSDTHHIYPRSMCDTTLKRMFSELPDNKEQLCRVEHELRHRNDDPPEFPSTEAMLGAILLSVAKEEVYLSNNKAKKLGLV